MGVNARAILTGETATLDLLEFIYGCKASSDVRLVPTGDGGFRLCFNWLNEVHMLQVDDNGSCQRDYENIYPHKSTLHQLKVLGFC